MQLSQSFDTRPPNLEVLCWQSRSVFGYHRSLVLELSLLHYPLWYIAWVACEALVHWEYGVRQVFLQLQKCIHTLLHPNITIILSKIMKVEKPLFTPFDKKWDKVVICPVKRWTSFTFVKLLMLIIVEHLFELLRYLSQWRENWKTCCLSTKHKFVQIEFKLVFVILLKNSSKFELWLFISTNVKKQVLTYYYLIIIIILLLY